MEVKWYSEGLTEEKANSLKMEYAKIIEIDYRNNSKKPILDISLRSESGLHFVWSINSSIEMKNFFSEICTPSNKSIRGKVIEIYYVKNIIKGISVNRYLV